MTPGPESEDIGPEVYRSAKAADSDEAVVCMDTSGIIKEVWADNLHEVFKEIAKTVEDYKYIAMDTEFPGIVVKPSTVGSAHLQEYNYQTVKGNVDLLRVIQLGITFANAHGCLPDGISTWQFNFKFDLGADMYAHDSIEFLRISGIDFERHKRNGIDVETFGELIMTSGLIMNEDVKWISFHGSYDFGYLLNLLTCQKLPNSQIEFFELLHDYFPALYDIKFLLRSGDCNAIQGGTSLQRIAEHLEVQRVGPQHQAGSDSLVTCHTFFRLMASYFENQIDDSKFSGVIYGLGGGLMRNDPTIAAPVAGMAQSNGIGGGAQTVGGINNANSSIATAAAMNHNSTNSNQLTFTGQVHNAKHNDLQSLNSSLSQANMHMTHPFMMPPHHGRMGEPRASDNGHHDDEGVTGNGGSISSVQAQRMFHQQHIASTRPSSTMMSLAGITGGTDGSGSPPFVDNIDMNNTIPPQSSAAEMDDNGFIIANGVRHRTQQLPHHSLIPASNSSPPPPPSAAVYAGSILPSVVSRSYALHRPQQSHHQVDMANASKLASASSDLDGPTATYGVAHSSHQ